MGKKCFMSQHIPDAMNKQFKLKSKTINNIQKKFHSRNFWLKYKKICCMCENMLNHNLLCVQHDELLVFTWRAYIFQN